MKKKGHPKPAEAAVQASAQPSPRTLELREQLMRVLRSRSLRDPIASMCEELQLTSPQAHTLIWLGYEGPLTMGLLARRARINDKSITGVVDRLEAVGLVERVRSPEDRRAVSVQLTTKGQKLYRQLDELINIRLGQLLELLDPDDQAALFRLLERIAERLQARQTARAEDPEA